MAQIEKLGGPYTKPEQELRRDKVFELHFETGHSAVHIAKILGINRNTINKDIEYWFTELRNTDKFQYNRNWLDKELARLEFQQTRLQQELEKDPPIKEKLQIERCIIQITMGIANLIAKIEISRKFKNL